MRTAILFTAIAIILNILFAGCSEREEENVVPPVSGISGVTVTPSTSDIPKGYAFEFTATVTGDKLSEADKSVTWTVTGSTRQETKITADGVLTIAAAETAETLTIKAISIADNSKNGTATVTVYEHQGFLFDCTDGTEIVEIEINGEKISCNYVDGLYIIQGDIKNDNDIFEKVQSNHSVFAFRRIEPGTNHFIIETATGSYIIYQNGAVVTGRISVENVSYYAERFLLTEVQR